MSSPFRRKNPQWYWAAEFDQGGLSAVGTFNPYVGPIPGNPGVSSVGYFNATSTGVSNETGRAWRDNWFGGEFVGFDGGCCWTGEHFYFVHNPPTSQYAGLWRTDRWLTTQPVRLWTREQMGMGGRYSFAITAFPEFDCIVMWLGQASGGPNAGPRAVRVKLSGPPNVGAQQYVQHAPGSQLRGWASDRINGRLFICYQQSNGDHNVEGLQLTANNGLTNPLSSLYVTDPGARSVEDPPPRILYQPTYDYLLGRILIPEVELERSTHLPVTTRIVDLTVLGDGPEVAQAVLEYPSPFAEFDLGDGTGVQRDYYERPISVFTNGVDRKIYQIRHRLIENMADVDEAYGPDPAAVRAAIVGQTGLWQYDYASIPAASQGATRNLVNPERLCDDPLEANFGTTVFNDVQRIAYGPGCRADWET